MLIGLAVCHTVRVDTVNEELSNGTLNGKLNGGSSIKKQHEIEYQSSSPDEKALVEACRRWAIEMFSVTEVKLNGMIWFEGEFVTCWILLWNIFDCIIVLCIIIIMIIITCYLSTPFLIAKRFTKVRTVSSLQTFPHPSHLTRLHPQAVRCKFIIHSR